MPITFKVKKESLEGPKKIPNGIYDVRLDTFEPEFSKDKKSYNFRPVMKIINNPEHNNQRVWENLNSNASWIQTEFCHAFGVVPWKDPQNPDGDPSFPVQFEGDMEKPKDWRITRCDMLGATARVEVAETANGKWINVKRYLCKIPGCTYRHRDNLL